MEPYQNTKINLLFEMVKILEFDAEMRHASGKRPDKDRDVRESGQMLELRYDPQALTLKNLDTLIDIIHHQLSTERETLVDLYPEVGRRFDAIKLKYLFMPTPNMNK